MTKRRRRKGKFLLNIKKAVEQYAVLILIQEQHVHTDTYIFYPAEVLILRTVRS